MLKTLFIFLFGLMMVQHAKAQKQDTLLYYIGHNDEIVDTKEKASYFCLIMNPDSSVDKNLYPIKALYLDGKVKMIGHSSSATGKLHFEGAYIDYYPNGKKKSIGTYKDDKIVGPEVDYYPNGNLYTSVQIDGKKIKLIECRDSTGAVLAQNGNGKWVGYDQDFKYITIQGTVKDSLKEGEWDGMIGDKVFSVNLFKRGDFISGTYYDKEGKQYSYTSFEVEPYYKDGAETGFARFLGNNIKYPAGDKKNGVQGKVIVQFVIERDGSISNVKAIRGPSQAIMDEAVRVVSLSPDWVPGIQNGSPVRVQFTIPINFGLGN